MDGMQHKRACNENASKIEEKGMNWSKLYFGGSRHYHVKEEQTSERDRGKWKHKRAWEKK